VRTLRSWGATENLSLSDAELARCEPIAAEGGKTLRAFCPFHGSDNQRSLRVNVGTGRFKCFACDAWGYLETARERRRSDHRGAGRPHLGGASATPRRVPRPAPAPAPRPELAEQMARYRAALPGSPGAAYLAERRIPLDVAQRVGVGYAAPGHWAHVDETGRRVRDWHRGRLVFPHTDPAGNVVSLYGRAVGDVFRSDAEKRLKHDHLAGAKGYFNAQALAGGSEPVTVCEGAFDALALMAAGAPRVVAIFGVNGWRWDWATEARELIFALDGDPAGQAGFRELARAATLRGKRVAYLEPDAYGGEKDAAAAWHAGVLTLGSWREVFPAAPPPPAETRHEPPTRATSERRPMLWGDALQACEGLAFDAKLAAYTLSQTYLEDGPALLAALEASLWETVATLPAGGALPVDLVLDVFAWKNAAYMARRRRDDDLPPAWDDPAQAERRRRYRDT
jgi:hypothetical protein